MQNFVPRLKTLGVSCAELARSMGYRHHGHVWERLSGNRPISVAFARKVEAALDGRITAIELLGLDHPPTSFPEAS